MRYKKLLSDLVFPTIALIIIFSYLLKEYFVFSGSSILGLILLPIILRNNETSKTSNVYAYLMIVFLALAYLCTINTIIYLSCVSAFLFIIEKNFSKQGVLPFIYLIVISPIFIYFGNFFGIPARLALTELAGNILNFIDFKNKVAGNLIITEVSEFSVDPACVGLHMLNVSFMLAIVIARHYEYQFKKQLNFFAVTLYLGIVLLLNLSGNLIRIILLVLFKVGAEKSLHDTIGILCIIIYVLIPLWFISKAFYKNLGKEKNESTSSLQKSSLPSICLTLCLLLISGHFLKLKTEKYSHLPAFCIINGYKKSMAAKDVLKFENESALIYVKPVKSFYGSEHTPMICWVGSGYSFKKIKKIKLNSVELFTGVLIKGQDLIYCCWWFDNGTEKTIDQMKWRWDVMKGAKPYSLININAKDEKTLYSITNEIINKNIFITE